METWKILKDAEESQRYLLNNRDRTSAWARRCLNMVLNVEYLFKNNPLWEIKELEDHL